MKGWKGQAGSGRHSMGVDNYLLSDGSASPSASCTGSRSGTRAVVERGRQSFSHGLPDRATRIRYRALSQSGRPSHSLAESFVTELTVLIPSLRNHRGRRASVCV